MALDVRSLSIDQLRNVIANHQRQGRTMEPLCVEVVAELDRRLNQGLDLQVMINTLAQAARRQEFISYGEVAAANGADWQKVRRLMPKHLDNVLLYCHQRGLPYLTAIVVAKPHLQTGKFDPENLKGLINGLQLLGLSIADHEKFAKEEQLRVFDWGRSQPDGTSS